MTEHDDQFGPGEPAREFHASEDILVHAVPCDAHAEDVTETLVEDQFGACPAVDAAQDDREGVLPFAGLVHLLEQITVGFQVVHEALVPFYQDLQGLRGCQFFLGLFRLRSHGM